MSINIQEPVTDTTLNALMAYNLEQVQGTLPLNEKNQYNYIITFL